MAMSRKKRDRNKKNKDIDTLLEGKESLLSSMKPETVRGITGVLLFVVALLLFLAPLGLAGVVGEKIYGGIFYAVGIGYWLIPIIFIGIAWSLFKNGGYEHSRLRTIRGIGAFFFFISTLGIVAVTASDGLAGWLGAHLADFLVRYLATIGTLVVLAGFFIISLLLLFDSALWVILGQKFFGLFKRSDEEETDEEVAPLTETEIEALTADGPPVDGVAAASAQTPSPSLEDEEDYVLPDEPAQKIEKKKREKVFQLPSEYTPPPLELLEGDRGKVSGGDTKIKANIIRKTLQHFKIPVEMDDVIVGPTVTRYSLKPAAGVKLSKIVALQSNLELALAASPIRIEAPIPGKSLVGIEVPNSAKSFVGLSGLFSSPEFAEETVPLFIALGKDITGSAHYANIGKMPHLLVAGTTGSGKSVMIHTIVASLLYRNGPDRLRLILIDPKRVELTLYNDIPHLLTPVITDAKKCILSLKWAAKEMERRYDILSAHKMQDISGYHNEIIAPAYAKYEKAKEKGADLEKIELPESMPHIVIVIDELADIMSSYPKELESAIVRLAQKSRAVGIHLILSTQRPSAQVITGLIKANVPTRIALKVASLLESRIILDQAGAEKLLGAGDMLYLSSDMAKPRRIQSPFLTTLEVRDIVENIIENNDPELSSIFEMTDGEGNDTSGSIPFDRIQEDDDLDDLYEEVRLFVVTEKKASTSFIQRRFKVGYGRAARIMDQLEERGVIAPSDGTNKPRAVLSAGEDIAEDGLYNDTPFQDRA